MLDHRSIVTVVLGLFAASAQAQVCRQGWSAEFGPALGAGQVLAQAIFDPDGPGPASAALYLGTTGSYMSDRLVRWDGASFDIVTPEVHSTSSYERAIQSMVVHDDDGPGPLPPALYMAGAIDRIGTVNCSGIVRWDGAAWTAVAPPDGSVGPWHLWTLDDGSLYAGAGRGYSIPSDLWRREGATWTRVGTNHALPFSINAVASFGAAGDETLYATGSSSSSTAVARLDGLTWTVVATGSLSGYGSPRFGPLAAFDADGSPVLVLGGKFDSVNGQSIRGLAQFDGQSWSAFHGGVWMASYTPAEVLSLAVLPDEPGGGQALYVGGWFSLAGSTSAQSIARFASGAWWSPIVGAYGRVSSIVPATLPSSQNTGVFIAGDIYSADGLPAYGLTGFTRLGWAPLGQALNNDVQAATTWTDPALGPGLYVGGGMTMASGRPAVGIARYDGHTWRDLAVGTNNRVTALTSFNGRLVAGGLFTMAGGVEAQHIASWDGTSWSPLGDGLNGPVRALAALDTKGGPVLYAGGEFTLAGSVATRNIARWDGAAWSALDSGTDAPVNALAAWRRPQGDSLIVGGSFQAAGSVAAKSVARWDGAHWSSLTPPAASISGEVFALTMHDEGEGPRLFAGGRFTIPGDPGWGNIAKLEDDRWTPLRGGLNGTIRALASWSTGNPRDLILFVGGDFVTENVLWPGNMARWVYHTWRPVGGSQGNLDGTVAALAASGPSVFFGGSFRHVSWQPLPRIGRWTQCTPCYVNCDGSNGAIPLDTADFICFLNRFSEGSLYANCDGSTAPPVLDVNDFVCFLNRFAVGCP